MDKLTAKEHWKEKRSLLYVLLIVIFIILLTTVIVYFKIRTFSSEDVCFSPECVTSAVYFMETLNISADPCDHFYNFVCGNYRGVSIIQSVHHLVNQKLRNLVTGAVKEEDSRSIKLQKKYYHSCMNLKAIEDDENQTLKKLFKKLGGWPVLEQENWNETKYDWGNIVEKCQKYGLYYDWFISLENRNEEGSEKLYINAPDNLNKINDTNRKNYQKLMTNVVTLLALPNDTINFSTSLSNVMEFEIKLLKIIEESRHNQVEYTAKHVKKKFPGIPWASVFRNVVINESDPIVFNVANYLPKLEGLLTETPKRIQADYIFWKLTESFSTFLSSEIRKEFETYANTSKDYSYPKDRQQYCYRLTSSVFGYLSESEYVRRYASKTKPIRKMVNEIRSVMRNHLNNARWMAEADKKNAVAKLENITVIIGGPEEMYNEKEFDTFLGIQQIDLFNINNTLEIVCEVDKKRDLYNLDFGRPKLTLEKAKLYQGVGNFEYLKYIPDKNIMFLPAVVMDTLFYTHNRPNFLNYGAIGAIIGHELAHGFGIMAAMSDTDDEKQWSNDTLNRFLKKAECLIDNCNDIGIENNYNVSCKKTFEENFADYTGINLSYEAFIHIYHKRKLESRLPGLPLTPNQLFWVMYASLMCNNMGFTNTQELTHMLPFQRILGSFRNSPHFAKDFDCPVESNMNPRKKCSIL